MATKKVANNLHGKDNVMAVNQFADISKDLCAQIKVIEKLLKCNLFVEADALMSNTKKSCRKLESLLTEDNKIQTRIVENRHREIDWIRDAIQRGLKKTRTKPVKKQNAKAK